jgi:hypothetical protein
MHDLLVHESIGKLLRIEALEVFKPYLGNLSLLYVLELWALPNLALGRELS